MSDYQSLILSCVDRTATITFNRPEAANGLNLLMASEFADAAMRCDANPDIKAIIVTGSGRFFCAGGDIKSMLDSPLGAGSGVKQIADQLHRALSTLARSATPVIVAVNGTAAGAGFSMAVMGDLVVAAESAKFTMAYSKIGLSPDGSASYFLPRLVGLRKTQELMFTNKVLGAQEALEWGLINRVVADDALLSTAQEWAQLFVSGARGSNAAIKTLLLASDANGLETQMELESQLIAQNANTEDGQEGIAAFLEKRSPEFM